MLKKLLKYDLRAIFKYWWIVAIASLGVSLFGGVCVRVLDISTKTPNPSFIVISLATIGLYLTIFVLPAFLAVTEIFVLIRLYKNFFTDEGYLTFTLPVKRAELLNSKLIATFIALFATVSVIAFDVFLILLIGVPDVFGAESILEFFAFFGDAIADLGIYFFIYLAEILLISLLSGIASILLVYICLTFAAVIAKKAKVITAIGIYYGVSAAVAYAFELVYFFGLILLATSIITISDVLIPGLFVLILFVFVAFLAAATVAMYVLEYWLLDKKLNLS